MSSRSAGLAVLALLLACTPTPPPPNGGRSNTGGALGSGGISASGTGGISGGSQTPPAASGGSTGAAAGGTVSEPSGSGGAGGTSMPAPSSDAAVAEPDTGPTIGDVAPSVDALPPPPPLVITYPPLMACARASLDRLTAWNSHAGSMRPTGNLLAKEDGRDVVKVEFTTGSVWHEVVVPVANSLSAKADLSKSRGMTVTYSATADFQVQLRPLSHAHGSAQYTAMLPSTTGMVKELTLPFAEPTWGAFLGKPTFPISVALGEANFFNFIGRAAVANTIVIKGLRIDGYSPPCN